MGHTDSSSGMLLGITDKVEESDATKQNEGRNGPVQTRPSNPDQTGFSVF